MNFHVPTKHWKTGFGIDFFCSLASEKTYFSPKVCILILSSPYFLKITFKDKASCLLDDRMCQRTKKCKEHGEDKHELQREQP